MALNSPHTTKSITVVTEYHGSRAEWWHVDDEGNKLTLLRSRDYVKPPYHKLAVVNDLQPSDPEAKNG